MLKMPRVLVKEKTITSSCKRLSFHSISDRTLKRLLGIVFSSIILILHLGIYVDAGRVEKSVRKKRKIKDFSKLRVGVTNRPNDCPIKSRRGNYLIIHYNATVHPVTNKTVDSSYERESPFRFRLGHQQVIPGLEKGLFHMCIGEHRKLVIPPNLAYGDVGAGHDIPPDSTLIYNVELLDLIDGDSDVGKQIERESWFEEVQF